MDPGRRSGRVRGHRIDDRAVAASLGASPGDEIDAGGPADPELTAATQDSGHTDRAILDPTTAIHANNLTARPTRRRDPQGRFPREAPTSGDLGYDGDGEHRNSAGP